MVNILIVWLAKFLALCGFGSRRKCIELIQNGCVSVNDIIIKDPVIQITNQSIHVNGKKAEVLTPELFLYYKKPGYIVSHKDENRPTIFDDTSQSLISVGRLDYYTEGLILLTNNSDIAHFWETSRCVREYYIICRGKKDFIWQEYYTINGIHYGPVKLVKQAYYEGYLHITLQICEGKNREIRNICTYLDWKIHRLIRTRFGPFHIDQIRDKLTKVSLGTLKLQK